MLDGIIIKGEKREIADAGSVDLAGKDIVVVQTNRARLGMYPMGQAFFSREIMRRYCPRSIETVAICGQGDAEMEALCRQFNIGVVIIPDHP